MSRLSQPELKESGLVFGDEFPVIKRISGPVSMYLLTHESPLYPSVLLFGDSHSFKTNPCSPCQCEIGSSYPCCSEISDIKRFLEPLNSLAATHGPIDFFLESFPAGILTYYLSSYLTDLEQIVAPCMVLQSGSTQCRFQNIRWQGGDVRRSNIDAADYNLSELTAIIHGRRPNSNRLQFKSTFENMTQCRVIEGAFDRFYYLCYNLKEKTDVTFLELLYSPYWDTETDETLLRLKIIPVIEHMFQSINCQKQDVKVF